MISIVPIRSGSKGIPHKNIKLLNGKPLVWWVLNSLEKSVVDSIIVATDKDYVNIIKSFNFSKVEIFIRDPKNSRDDSSTEDVLIEVIKTLNINDDILLSQSTSPLTKYYDYDEAIKKYKNYDSLLSVVKQYRFIWDKNGKSLNYDYTKRPRRQDFDGQYVENGAIYINHSDNILKYKNRLSGKIGLYEMSEDTYYEIDDKNDWIIIENLIKNER